MVLVALSRQELIYEEDRKKLRDEQPRHFVGGPPIAGGNEIRVSPQSIRRICHLRIDQRLYRQQLPCASKEMLAFKGHFSAMRKNVSSLQLRSFTSSRLHRQEYLILAQDIQEPETLERRKNVRPAHLDSVQEAVEVGTFLWGGAMLHDGKPIGSAVLLQADNVEQIRQQIKNDPYIEGRVWDPAKIQIIPFRTAVTAFDRNQKSDN